MSLIIADDWLTDWMTDWSKNIDWLNYFWINLTIRMVMLTIINSSVKPLPDPKRSNFSLYVYKRYYVNILSYKEIWW